MIVEWILSNKEWLFSGVGVSILSFVIYVVFKSKTQSKVIMRQTNTWGATGTQIGTQNNYRDKSDG